MTNMNTADGTSFRYARGRKCKTKNIYRKREREKERKDISESSRISNFVLSKIVTKKKISLGKNIHKKLIKYGEKKSTFYNTLNMLRSKNIQICFDSCVFFQIYL